MLAPRAVLVHRRSAYDELLARHGTRQQAEFFLATRGRSIDDLLGAHADQERALRLVAGVIPPAWRRADVERDDLARFTFAPEDIVVVVGRDGLVANAAKYLDGQPVVGIDPEPGRNPGVLVPHPPEAAAGLLAAAADDDGPFEERTMVEAVTDDGQVLRALNEVYIGQPTHQSARYRLELPDRRRERQSSSGVLIGTGTGGTGWLRSTWLARNRPFPLPHPTDADLCWFVREPWPSPTTGAELTEGVLHAGDAATVHVESDLLVCFGDGIERDAIPLTWGQRLEVRASDRRLRLVTA